MAYSKLDELVRKLRPTYNDTRIFDFFGGGILLYMSCWLGPLLFPIYGDAAVVAETSLLTFSTAKSYESFNLTPLKRVRYGEVSGLETDADG